MKIRKADKFSTEELREILNSSNTQTEALKKLGYSSLRSTYCLIEAIHNKGLEPEFNALKERSRNLLKNRTVKIPKTFEISKESLFRENSPYERNVVRHRILRDNLIEYKCSECGITEYNNKPISLQLDHINGVNNDNRLENLRWLCPNCHSQTETYAGKNVKINKLRKAEKEIRKAEKEKVKKERIAFLDSLDTTKFGWVEKAAKEFGISHTQVKRWITHNYPELIFYTRNK